MTFVPEAPHGRRSGQMPLWAQVLVWAVVAAVAIGAAFVLWVAAALSGGFDDLLDVSQPSETSREVVRARERTEPGLAAEARELAAVSGLRALDVAVGKDECREGQHNWKIDDDFDLSCRGRQGVLLAGSADEVPAGVERLLAQLAADGYVAPYDGSELDVAGARALVQGFDVPLPEGRYDRGERDVAVVVAGRRAEGLRFYPPLELRRGGAPVDEAGVVSSLAPGEHLVVVVVSETYFEE